MALYVTGFFDAQRFIEGGPAIQQLASEMVPPNFERWEHWVIPLRDTLAMSIAGTALTVLASLPLALVAAPNTAPNAVVGRIVRTILAAFRSVPE
ncbi:MAG: phosphonate ABC transporter, permease protein PhnE, partial [Hydrogenophaga sp.]|nr:phosphonate ABC transporter, permease protein PhnE [Hydrogenophaga sp.]